MSTKTTPVSYLSMMVGMLSKKKDDADADATADLDADDYHDLFFFYGKGGRCFSQCPGNSKGCAPH